MGNTRTDQHPFVAPDTPSFLDLLDRVTADEQLDQRRKADLRSAIKSLGQWLGSDLTSMPAHPRYLRERLACFQPAAAGVSRKRLQNVRSAIAFALDRYGLGGRRSYLAPLSPAAQALYDCLPDTYFRCRLSRLLHFISAQGIEPEQMTDAVGEEFLAALEQHSVIKHVRTTYQDACRAWNKARGRVPGWPAVELTVPCYQQTYGLPWTDFPASLEAAVDAWFVDPVDDGDFFADSGRTKPLSPRTITTQKDHLRGTASALVRSAHEPSAIVDLSYLVRPRARSHRAPSPTINPKDSPHERGTSGVQVSRRGRGARAPAPEHGAGLSCQGRAAGRLLERRARPHRSRGGAARPDRPDRADAEGGGRPADPVDRSGGCAGWRAGLGHE